MEVVIERDPAYWLRKAEEARTRADHMRDASAKKTFLDIAASYERMAQRADAREVRLRARSKKPLDSK